MLNLSPIALHTATKTQPSRSLRYRMKLLSGIAVLGILVGTTLIAPPAMAQQNTQARLDRLENEIDTLSRALFKGDIPQKTGDLDTGNASERAALQVRLSDLERDIRELTGQLEEQQYEMRRFREEIEQRLQNLDVMTTGSSANRSAQDLEQREKFSPLPGQAGTGAIKAEPATGLTAGTLHDDETKLTTSAAAPPVKDDQTLGQLSQSDDGSVKAVADDPIAAYEEAFTALKDSDYAKAEEHFKTFLKTYGDHSLAANAKYWLGETYYVRGNFEQAARTFAAAYQEHPDGSKGPDNLLKLALSLDGLGKREDACLTLQQLMKEYPSGAEPVVVRAEQEIKRMSCQ